MAPLYIISIQKRGLENCPAKSGAKKLQLIWDFLLQFVAFINGIRGNQSPSETPVNGHSKSRKTTLLCNRERLLWALLRK
jgi:hypothetical protein